MLLCATSRSLKKLGNMGKERKDVLFKAHSLYLLRPSKYLWYCFLQLVLISFESKLSGGIAENSVAVRRCNVTSYVSSKKKRSLIIDCNNSRSRCKPAIFFTHRLILNRFHPFFRPAVLLLKLKNTKVHMYLLLFILSCFIQLHNNN